MNKLPWESLPSGRVAAIEELTGPVVKAESAAGGLMPGLAAIVHGANGRYFVKAAPADSPAARLYEREMATNAALCSSVPAPPIRYSSGEDGWLVMVFDYLDARDADLSPIHPTLTGRWALLQRSVPSQPGVPCRWPRRTLPHCRTRPLRSSRSKLTGYRGTCTVPLSGASTQPP